MSAMNIKMNDSNIVSVAQLRELVKLTGKIEFNSSSTKEEMYKWIEEVLGRLRYFSLKKKKERGIVISYIRHMTGLSRGHVKKLIKRKRRNGRILRITGTRYRIPKVYDAEDIARLIETENVRPCDQRNIAPTIRSLRRSPLRKDPAYFGFAYLQSPRYQAIPVAYSLYRKNSCSECEHWY